MQRVRIWDLPTRLFHWLLAACVIGLVVTAKVGGEAMNWHLRLGYAVFGLLVFRLLWGLVGGHWSRFASFVPTPGRLARYLGGRASAADTAGHNPLGALSVLAMLAVLGLQVATGLMADGLSTAFMVLGADKALALAERLTHVDALLIHKDGRQQTTAHFPKLSG